MQFTCSQIISEDGRVDGKVAEEDDADGEGGNNIRVEIYQFMIPMEPNYNPKKNSNVIRYIYLKIEKNILQT